MLFLNLFIRQKIYKLQRPFQAFVLQYFHVREYLEHKMNNKHAKHKPDKKSEKDDVIVLDEKGKEDFDLGRDELDAGGDDELDMSDDGGD